MRLETAGAFSSYLIAVEACFVETDRGLELPGDGLDVERTTALLDTSEALGEAIASEAPVLSDPDLETASLAAAALDFIVGADLLRLEAENAIFSPTGASGEEIASRPEYLEPVAEILEDARRAFPQQLPDGMAGAALPPQGSLDIAKAAITELVTSAAEPAGKFTVGLFAAGLGQASEALVHLANMPNPFRLSGGGNGLFRRGVRKLLSIVGSDVLREALTDFQFDLLAEQTAEKHSGVSAWALGTVVRAPHCEEEVAKLFSTRAVNTGVLGVKLEELRGTHRTNMRWGRRAAAGMTWGGPFVIVASGGAPGVIGIAGARALGLAVIVYLLADRLDTLPERIDLIAGVQRISAECVLP